MENVEALTAGIADTLRRERASRQMTLADVAKKTRISAATLSRYENGDRQITVVHFHAICEAYDIWPGSVLDTATEYADRVIAGS